MSTADRVAALAAEIQTTTDLTVYGSADLAAGRGDVWLYIGPPTYVYDEAALTLCRPGRKPRLSAAVVVVGPGTAPGQIAALLTAVDNAIDAMDVVTGWEITGDATPFEYAGTPAYEIPITAR